MYTKLSTVKALLSQGLPSDLHCTLNCIANDDVDNHDYLNKHGSTDYEYKYTKRRLLSTQKTPKISVPPPQSVCCTHTHHVIR
jgi:hypothetical protein